MSDGLIPYTNAGTRVMLLRSYDSDGAPIEVMQAYPSMTVYLSGSSVRFFTVADAETGAVVSEVHFGDPAEPDVDGYAWLSVHNRTKPLPEARTIADMRETDSGIEDRQSDPPSPAPPLGVDCPLCLGRGVDAAAELVGLDSRCSLCGGTGWLL